MSRDEAKKILGENATEEQITNFLNYHHEMENAKGKEIQTLKDQIAGYSDYDTIKQQLDDINKANMTEQEQIASKNKEADEKLKQANIYYNEAKARQILAGYNISDKDIQVLVRADESETIANATSFKETLDNIQNEVAKRTKEELMSQNVLPSMNEATLTDDDVMTKDKFEKLSMLEQKQWKDNNIDEYHKLYQ